MREIKRRISLLDEWKFKLTVDKQGQFKLGKIGDKNEVYYAGLGRKTSYKLFLALS